MLVQYEGRIPLSPRMFSPEHFLPMRGVLSYPRVFCMLVQCPRALSSHARGASEGWFRAGHSSSGAFLAAVDACRAPASLGNDGEGHAGGDGSTTGGSLFTVSSSRERWFCDMNRRSNLYPRGIHGLS